MQFRASYNVVAHLWLGPASPDGQFKYEGPHSLRVDLLRLSDQERERMGSVDGTFVVRATASFDPPEWIESDSKPASEEQRATSLLR